MFPDDAHSVRAGEVGAFGKDDDSVGFGGRHHLAHIIIGDGSAHGRDIFSKILDLVHAGGKF